VCFVRRPVFVRGFVPVCLRMDMFVRDCACVVRVSLRMSLGVAREFARGCLPVYCLWTCNCACVVRVFARGLCAWLARECCA
jgi:hypothetical protein